MKTRDVKARGLDMQAFFPDELQVVEVKEDNQRVMIELKSQKHSHICPNCGYEMSIYHATYKRRAQDLPILGKNVTLEITAYEYTCSNQRCDTRTFAEDYDGFLVRSGRMTVRLEDFIRMMALESNCEGAAAICREMGIRISGDTIINMLRKLADRPMPTCGESIGVDDFAYRKGHTYCTVICDGETHRPIDILEGRDGEALYKWLQKNKHVKKVARDRAGAYAKAISTALPEAMQIADRFHLHQNLLCAIKEALRVELPNKIKIPESDHVADEMLRMRRI